MISGHSERSEESHTLRDGNGSRCEMLRCAQHDAGWAYVRYFGQYITGGGSRRVDRVRGSSISDPSLAKKRSSGRAPVPEDSLPDIPEEERRPARMRLVAGRRLGGVRVVLDGVHDPHNISAVLRSCEGFGVQHVHLVGLMEGLPVNRAITLRLREMAGASRACRRRGVRPGAARAGVRPLGGGARPRRAADRGAGFRRARWRWSSAASMPGFPTSCSRRATADTRCRCPASRRA